MFCAISGSAPNTPVVSKATGHVYEKDLLAKYIATEGKCPMTGEEMSMDDVVEVKANKAVRPRPATAASIPGMLTLFQDEWDALMLETYQLKQHLDTVRQELVKTLYQHDAACRVIARLVAERDEARHALTSLQAAAASAPAAAAPAAAAMDVDEPKITTAVHDAMQAKFEVLQQSRKGRSAPADLASVEALAGYGETAASPLHQTGKPGITALSVDPKDPSTVVTGGKDGQVIVFNKDSGKVTKTLKAHSKAVTSVHCHPDRPIIFSTSADKVVKMFTDLDKGTAIKAHSAEVTDLTVHPCGNYIATASMDSTWAFTDIGADGGPTTLVNVTDSNVSDGFTCIQFHPDGLLLGAGSAKGLVQVFDVRKQQAVATLPEHTAAVNSLTFSENGYTAASGSDDGTAIVWDLRKLGKNNGCIKKIDVGSAVNAVSFDFSGTYLAIAADDVRVLKAKKPWDIVATYSGHKSAVTSVAWGPSAQWLVSGSMDRNLKFWGA